MGNGLARQVSAEWGHLPGNAFKVLTYMAWTALDVPNEQGRPARLYFGGMDPLMLALGRRPESAKDRRAAERRVYEALKALEGANAIQRTIDNPGAKNRQCYLLMPDTCMTETVTQCMTETVTHLPDGNRRIWVTETDTPRKEEESKGGKDSRSEDRRPAQQQAAPGHEHEEIFRPCDLHPWEPRHIEGECFACSTEQSTGQPVLEPAMHAYEVGDR